MDKDGEILALDMGIHGVGIISVGDGVFTAYQGEQIQKAIKRIMQAKEVIVEAIPHVSNVS